jgi:hypothetical protein
VYTSSIYPNAGTDGAVYVTLHGSAGLPITSTCQPGGRAIDQHHRTSLATAAKLQESRYSSGVNSSSSMTSSARIQLTSGDIAAFQAGGVGSFNLPAMKNLGQLRQLTLELADDKVLYA